MSNSEINNLLRIHYQFTDNEHFMDAYTFNKCEYQILGIVREAAKLITYDVTINVEALEEGSIWERLKLTSKEGHHIKIEWIIAAAIGMIITPVGHTLKNAIDWGFEYLKDGAYIHSLKSEKERLQLEKDIRELRQDSLDNATPESENKIKRKVSNFYSEVKKDNRVVSVGFNSTVGEASQAELLIDRHDFDTYIISDNLEEEHLHTNVRIDIIAPVLKKGRTKWRGVFNGDPIPFLMKDVDFKKSVIGGSIVFTGGSYIVCDLNIYTSVDKEGETHISGYEVISVHSYGIDNQPSITTEGEKRRIKQRELENQPTLFDGLDDFI